MYREEKKEKKGSVMNMKFKRVDTDLLLRKKWRRFIFETRGVGAIDHNTFYSCVLSLMVRGANEGRAARDGGTA
jgi:hypothetical protein